MSVYICHIYVIYVSGVSQADGQWEFQDPKMEVLYHIRPYFGGISPEP